MAKQKSPNATKSEPSIGEELKLAGARAAAVTATDKKNYAERLS